MKYICFNGEIHPTNHPVISSQDRGFLLGDGLFETMLLKKSEIPHFKCHMQRLIQGCKILMLPSPDTYSIEKDIINLISRNNVCDGSIRLTLSRGTGTRGVLPPIHSKPTTLIQSFPQSNTPEMPINVCINTKYRRDTTSPLNQVKSLNYLPSILAKMEAKALGFDDTILLNQNNYIAEATSSNIIYCIGNKTYTPPVQDGALPGISRRQLLQNGLCEERSIHEKDCQNTSISLFLISSLFIRKISSINTKKHVENDKIYKEIKSILFP